MNKKSKLKNIAKRLAKTILMQCEASVIFSESGLISEDADYIQKYLSVIAERITSLDQECDVNILVKEELNGT